MGYLTSKEISKIWNVSDRMVRDYCTKGRVLNAYLEGKIWMIPEDAKKPIRRKRTNKKPRTLLKTLEDEMNSNVSGGIYHRLQIGMTYNSNHIEGSRLSHDQTRAIFETNTIGVSNNEYESPNVDDIIETKNHFRCIKYVISNAKKKLSESMIKQMHYLLKQNTSDADQTWFNVGDYKLLTNEVGNKEATKPEEVKKEMHNLLESYNSKSSHSIEEIIDFHYCFESIHPFQDGNGRVGRLIMLKECLKNNLVPILIKDEFKDFYFRGLNEYLYEKGYLIDTCLHGQDIFRKYLKKFNIKE